MRRQEKEITDMVEIEEIIRRARVCRIGLVDGEKAYVIPMNFGYRDHCLYLHCAQAGKKLDLLKKNNNVCFEVESEFKLIPAEKACDWNILYRSVIGWGRGELVVDTQGKKQALDIIMKQYSNAEYTYSKKALDEVRIVKVKIEEITGKKSDK